MRVQTCNHTQSLVADNIPGQFVTYVLDFPERPVILKTILHSIVPTPHKYKKFKSSN